MSSSEPPQPPDSGPPQPPQYPPPGYPPPGYPPPGYPPPGYPPQGYPPQGYPPQGYPLPGYPPQFPQGYPQQGGYQVVPPQYVPPAVYHVPATEGRQPEFVQAKQGSLIQAWFSLLLRPSRQNFAAWSQRATRGWAIGSIVTAGIIELLFLGGAMAGMVVLLNFLMPSINASTPGVTFNASFFTPFIVLTVVITPIAFIMQAFSIPFGQALFMSGGLGKLRQRYARAIVPWSLSLVGTVIACAVVGGIVATLVAVVVNRIVTQNLSTADAASTIGIALLVFTPFYIFLAVYQVMLQVQSGAVGAAMNRWAIFGINLLTGLVMGVIFSIILQPIQLIVLSHYLSSFSTTTIP